MSGPLAKIVSGTGGMALHNQPPEVKKKSGAIRQIEEDDKTDDDSKESLLDYFIIEGVLY